MFSKNKYRPFGLSQKQVTRFKSLNYFHPEEVLFKNAKLKISNPYWFLHSIDELFIDQVYKFKSSVLNPIIIDCGANWGLSIIYFKDLYPDSLITAFEADPNIFRLLSDNIESNKLNNVTLYNKAVWSKNEDLFFSIDGGLGGSITELGIKNSDKLRIEAVRFKEVLQQFDRVDFLKIDIEGAEYEVLKDCRDSLSHVQCLFIEYHSTPKQKQTLGEILDIVQNAGFKYYIKEAWNNMEHPFIEKKDLYYDLQLNIFCYK